MGAGWQNTTVAPGLRLQTEKNFKKYCLKYMHKKIVDVINIS